MRPTTAAPDPALEGMRPLASLLEIHDEAVRGVMQDWLHGVYAVESAPDAGRPAGAARRA